jgi:3-methyladenine DNA glycosylase AlkD
MEKEVISALAAKKDPVKASILSRFFKTGKGEYGEGDVFWGITMPEQRIIAREFLETSLPEIEKILASQVHEHRMTALLILLYQFKKSRKDPQKKRLIYDFFLAHTRYVNNWDLVDVICRDIVGGYLWEQSDRSMLYKLAVSSDLWERRIAMISTYEFIRHGKIEDTMKIAEILILDKHDLIRKAVGWMLREAFKKDPETVRTFLRNHIRELSRVTLRYAIEKMSKEEQEIFLSL